MEEEKGKPGRPLIWDDPEAFSKKVDEYFTQEEEPPTWTGLALFLGFSSRDSLNDYKKKDGFSDPIKKALLRIERKYEQGIFNSRNPAGAIFALKNFGWKDKNEIETDGKVEITVKYEKRDNAS
jgi:hypothetical protein